ncbi:hypothetical protein ACHAWF_008469 [Thalassiosira exigua]
MFLFAMLNLYAGSSVVNAAIVNGKLKDVGDDSHLRGVVNKAFFDDYHSREPGKSPGKSSLPPGQHKRKTGGGYYGSNEPYNAENFAIYPRLEDPDPNDLIWQDEFDGNAVNETKWGYDLGDGCDWVCPIKLCLNEIQMKCSPSFFPLFIHRLCNWGNNERAWYTKKNAEVSGGYLTITALKESGYKLPYTASRMVTRGLHTFTYGRVQFRASIAQCTAVGTWPALWMLPQNNEYGRWPDSGEIDVMEAVGFTPDTFSGTTHTKNFHGGNGRSGSITGSRDTFHTFEVNWLEDRIQFAMNGLIYHTVYKSGTNDPDFPFDKDFYLIMNLAVGGDWGGARGIDTNSFYGEGQILKVDWVRVYKNSPSPTPPSPSPPSDEKCGCQSCTQAWDAAASDSSGSYSCGDRITYLKNNMGYPEDYACAKVASEFPQVCPCDPATCSNAPPPAPTSSLSCDGQCREMYPYGCATNIANIVKYGCNKYGNGGCEYLEAGKSYSTDSFCTYKQVLAEE